MDKFLTGSKMLLAVEEALRTGVGVDKAHQAVRDAEAAGAVTSGLSATLIARLEQITGIAGSGGTAAEQLSRLVHAFQLGFDADKGKYLADEGQTGILFEE